VRRMVWRLSFAVMKSVWTVMKCSMTADASQVGAVIGMAIADMEADT
jgi:hypothetical protein